MKEGDAARIVEPKMLQLQTWVGQCLGSDIQANHRNELGTSRVVPPRRGRRSGVAPGRLSLKKAGKTIKGRGGTREECQEGKAKKEGDA